MSSVETRAAQWIVNEDTGLSSKAIWAHCMGVIPEDGWSHPWDPADLGRCLRLLHLIPEWRPKLQGMRCKSETWRRLVNNWAELESAMENEVGIDWSKGRTAPITYHRLKNVIGRD